MPAYNRIVISSYIPEEILVDFKDYMKSKKSKGNGIDNEEMNRFAKTEQGQDVKEKIKQYGNKSEGELMNEVRRITNNQKKNGSFNANELENFYRSAAHMLTPDQAAKMRGIIESLKN